MQAVQGSNKFRAQAADPQGVNGSDRRRPANRPQYPRTSHPHSRLLDARPAREQNRWDQHIRRIGEVYQLPSGLRPIHFPVLHHEVPGKLGSQGQGVPPTPSFNSLERRQGLRQDHAECGNGGLRVQEGSLS